MLNKLLKHEFIATGRIMGTVYAVVLALAAYILGSYYITRDNATPAQILAVSILLIISTCNFILTAVVMIANFQKSLYGDQGYLSFTLPVKGSALLSSKIIASTTWFVAAFACFFGTAAITIFILKRDIIGEESYQTLESLVGVFLGGKSITTIITTVVAYLIGYFIRFAVFTVELYFAISLANTRLFQKKYVLWTIIFSVGILIIVSKISDLLAQAIQFGILIDGKSMSFVTQQVGSASTSYINLSSVLISLVFGVAFYFATFYVMNKRVNIR